MNLSFQNFAGILGVRENDEVTSNEILTFLNRITVLERNKPNEIDIPT
jgi:hypothetical protein